MRPVIQQEPTGCGIASVAVIAGVGYAQSKAAAASLGIFASAPSLWTHTSYVRRLLAHYGFHTRRGETPFTSWEALPGLALLATKWHLERGTPFWHWTVFAHEPDGPVVFDSKRTLRNHLRRDFGRIKPRWYIEVLC
jgi:hypothetical protein